MSQVTGPRRVAFVAPYFTDNARLFLRHAAATRDVALCVVSQEDPARLGPELRAVVADYERVDDALSSDAIEDAARRLGARGGAVERLIGIVEQLQEPLGEARERLGLPGMRAEVARRFRDKNQMKDLLRAAGVPVARHAQVATRAAALAFAAEVGWPLVVKPPAGAASQTTFRVESEVELDAALGPTSLAAGGVVLLEEFVTGEEHSFDAFFHDGEVTAYSTSDYHPTPLEVMKNPWMQWVVVLPREHEQSDVAQAGAATLRALGMERGMCHLEWFRRKDGTLVVSEVAARPPGAQFPTMISRAHEVDCVGAWAAHQIWDEAPRFPPLRFAVGAAYLRGQGEGRVRAVHGLDAVLADLGELACDVRRPVPGQEKSKSYEGEGFVIVRHPDTSRVREALTRVISTVRVELS